MLFCKLKQIFYRISKFLTRGKLSWFCHTLTKHFKVAVMFPICMACCLTVIDQCPIKATNAEAGQIITEFCSCGIDRIYGSLSPTVFFFNGDVGSGVRINTFKLYIDNISELFRSFKVTSPRVAYTSEDKSCQGTNNQLVRDGDGQDRVDKFFQFWIPIWLMGLILGVLLAR